MKKRQREMEGARKPQSKRRRDDDADDDDKSESLFDKLSSFIDI